MATSYKLQRIASRISNKTNSTNLGNLMISKYILHSQYSKSDAINSSIVWNLSIDGSITPRNSGVLYLKEREKFVVQFTALEGL